VAEGWMSVNYYLQNIIFCHNSLASNLFLIILTFYGEIIMKVFLRSMVGIFLALGLSFSFSAMAVEHQKETSSHQVATSVLNINTADAQTIFDAHIKGIGKKRAEAIVAYRQAHGPFKSVDDLKKIKGLSDKVIDANRERITLN
jgi:competence protein ComEA